jgi:HD-like signal output (HDOD) protein
VTLTVDGVLEEATELTSLPGVYQRVMAVINHPRASLGDVAQALSSDAGISAKILRIANSAMFGFPGKIDDIGRAVTMIGTQQVHDLLLATAVTDMFAGVDHKLVNMDGFWRHSIGVAITARALAARRKENNVERFFLAGVMHDAGRLLLLQCAAEAYAPAIQMARDKRLVLRDVEEQMFGFDHATMGGALLKSWHLPAALEQAVEYHHFPRLASRYERDAALLHVAEISAHALELGHSGCAFVPPLDPAGWDATELSTGDLAPAVNQVDQQYGTALKLFLAGAG